MADVCFYSLSERTCFFERDFNIDIISTTITAESEIAVEKSLTSRDYVTHIISFMSMLTLVFLTSLIK